MTNFSGSPAGPITRERLLLWGPALLGGLLAAVAGGLLLLPQVQRLQLVQQQVEDLKAQQQRLPLLRRQLTVLSERHSQAQQRQRQLLELIQGSGELRTFLAQLNREARASGVQLEGYEPISAAPVSPAPAAPGRALAAPAAQAATAPAGAAAPGLPPRAPGVPGLAAPPSPVDPLQDPGLRKNSLLLRARGHGPQLQQFLRRLERLGLLVVQSDLSLKLEGSETTNQARSAASNGNGAALLNLTLSLYGPAETAGAGP